MPTQDYATHRHNPRLTGVGFMFLLLAVVGLALRWFGIGGRYAMALGLVGLIAAIQVLLIISRVYTTKLQDRIIRLEMKVRGMTLLTAGAAGSTGPAQQAAGRRVAVCIRRGITGARRTGRSRQDDGRSDQAGDQELGARLRSYVASGFSRTSGRYIGAA